MKRARRKETARSRKGCNECRRRKVKCDESKPQCGQCRKAGVECSVIDSVFRPHPYTFSADVGGSTANESSTQNETTVSADQAHENEDVAFLPPIAHTSTVHSSANPAGFHVNYEDNAGLSNGPTHYGVSPLERTSTNDGVHMMGVNWTSPLAHATSHSATSLPHLDSADDTHGPKEIAFLRRRFAECSAVCMDLFSREGYFSQQVLLLARESLLVKYAMCANAAKQIGHLEKPDFHSTRGDVRQIFTRLSSKSNNIDYLWYGAKYYGKAIQAMAEELSLDYEPTLGLSPDEVPWAANAPSGVSLPATSTEARLVAACIMCHYEELSASWRAWSRHLNGIYKLLRLDQIEQRSQNESPNQLPSPAIQPKRSFQAIFWYFAQNDFEESFISEKNTRLNPKAITLWQNAGLPLLDNGSLAPFCFHVDSSGSSEDLDLLALHTLLRLMCRINNYIFPKPRTIDSPYTATPGMDHAEDNEWNSMSEDLENWFVSLPPSFQPDIVSNRSMAEDHSAFDVLSKEYWFTSSTCAIAFVYYHTAKMLLMIHQPFSALAGSSKHPTDWIRSSRKLHHELSKYASELLAVALGQPSNAVRSHMVQPLYVAGRCLTQEADQRAVIEMLRSIEADLGIATGYRVTALVEEWGLSSLHGASGLDAELSDLSSNEQ